jgi:hypothetical protein
MNHRKILAASLFMAACFSEMRSLQACHPSPSYESRSMATRQAKRSDLI